MRWYTSIVAFVIVSDIFLTGSVKPFEKKPFKMEKKILKSVFYEGCGKDSMLK